MIRSDTLDALNEGLSAAQGQFEAVSKTADNPFFKSKYAALPDVVKAAAPILAEHGLAVWQGGDTDEAGELLWTIVLHKSGQYIGSAARLLPVKGDPQAQGSAITYQRRYQYMSALGLVADDDDDGNAASTTRPKPASRVKGPKQATTPAKPATGQSASKDASPPPVTDASIVGQGVLDQLKAMYVASGMNDNDLCWLLVSVGVESLPENPGKADIGAAMKGLTLEQAFKLKELIEGKDDGVPGSGEAK